jgi:predicted nucleic acid-binding protein
MAQLDTNNHGYVSTFDATFHALAIKEKCDFLTADESHIRRTEKLVGSVQSLSGLEI